MKSKTPGLDAIESHFKMNFEEVIRILHWENKTSLFRLSNECGISRDTFQRHAKYFNLKLMNSRDAALSSPFKKGKDHWAFGLRKENSKWAKAHSVRMKKENPCSNIDIMNKKQDTTASTYRKNPLAQEKLFAKFLKNRNVKYDDQYRIGPYIIDFFIPNLNLCIEIDSTFKWGKERKISASIKDEYLTKLGFKILRINKAHLKNKRLILDILNTHNVIGH